MTPATINKKGPHSEFFVELENVTLAYGRGDRQISALGLTNLRLSTLLLWVNLRFNMTRLCFKVKLSMKHLTQYTKLKLNKL